jgi:hypothetical protein
MGMARQHGHPGVGMARPQVGGNRGGHAPAHQQGKPKRYAAIASFVVFALKLAVSVGLAAYKLARPVRYCADV